MPKNSRKKRRRGGGSHGSRGGRVGGQYRSQIVKQQAFIQMSATSTSTGTVYAFPGFGPGAGQYFTPYSSSANYASLSDWGNFRLKKVVISPRYSTNSSAAADECTAHVAACLDETGADVQGGTGLTGAWFTIQGRDTGRVATLGPSTKAPTWSWKPREGQNKLWLPQPCLSGGTTPPAGQNWGPLVSVFTNSGTTVVVNIAVQWYFEVREPSVPGVLTTGIIDPEVRKRLERIERFAGVGKSAAEAGQDPDDDEYTARQVVMDVRDSLEACRISKVVTPAAASDLPTARSKSVPSRALK